MAIITTTFSAITQAGNASEVLAWLQSNASEYFDSITADASGNITCMIGNTPAIKLGFDGTTHTSFTLKNGVSMTHYYATTTEFFKAAIKTSKGIHLIPNSEESDSTNELFICKSDAGTTAFLSKFQHNNLSSRVTYHAADFENSPSIKDFLYYDGSSYRAFDKSVPASCTSLAHVVFDGGFFAPDLFIVPFSQFANTRCIYSIGNKKYSSNGFIALAD